MGQRPRGWLLFCGLICACASPAFARANPGRRKIAGAVEMLRGAPSRDTLPIVRLLAARRHLSERIGTAPPMVLLSRQVKENRLTREVQFHLAALGMAFVQHAKQLGVNFCQGIAGLGVNFCQSIGGLYVSFAMGISGLSVGVARALHALVDFGRGVGLSFTGNVDESRKLMGQGALGVVVNLVDGMFRLVVMLAVGIYRPLELIGLSTYRLVVALTIGLWRLLHIPWRLSQWLSQ